MEHYDVLVIGSGPAGHGAAIQAAKLNMRVAVVEKTQALGGASVNTGAIPSKALREAVLHLTGFRQRGVYGVSYKVKEDISIQDLTFRCDHVVENEIQVLRSQFNRNRVAMYEGKARLTSPNEVEIDGPVEGPVDRTTVCADKIIIAVGSTPARSSKIPVDGRSVIDSDHVYSLESIPRTVTIVGAGAIGMEYAAIFATLGVEATVVDKRRDILEFLDREILEALLYHLRQHGVIFRLGEEVTHVEADSSTVTAYTESNKRIVSEVLLYTVGRNGATEGLGLEAVGLEADSRGRIPVNDFYQTEVPHIYAVGDVVGFPALSSTSMEQGRIAACHALGIELCQMADTIPYALFTIPEISMVGGTEEQLTRQNVPYEVGLARYRETARGQILNDPVGTLKLLVHSETRKILGVHIIGEGASELVHIGQAIVGLGGSLDFLINNTFNYPTLAECYRIAALDVFNKLESR